MRVVPRFFALILILAMASASVFAGQRRDERSNRAEHSYRDEQNLRDARNFRASPRNDNRGVRDVVGEVERNYRGHVVDVQPPGANEDMYRVRVLQEGGRVKTLHVPAKREPDRDRR